MNHSATDTASCSDRTSKTVLVKLRRLTDDGEEFQYVNNARGLLLEHGAGGQLRIEWNGAERVVEISADRPIAIRPKGPHVATVHYTGK